MIKYKNEVFEDYFIDPITAIITDKDGNIQKTTIRDGRRYWRGTAIYKIQMHTHIGFQISKVIHHIDQNKLNDALSNLIYLTRAEHAKIHHLDKKVSEETKNKIRNTLTGSHISEETKNKIRNTLINKKPSIEMQKIISEKISQKIKGRIFCNNGIKNIYVYKDNIPEGFVKGRLKKQPKN